MTCAPFDTDTFRRPGAVKALILAWSAAVSLAWPGPIVAGEALNAPATGALSPQAPAAGSQAPKPGGSRLAQVRVDCAIFGTGYVQVQGTGNCVRIRSRMRIHEENFTNRSGDYPPFAGPAGANLPVGLRAPEPDPRQRWTR